MQHTKTISSKFSQWLFERYVDNISDKYSRPAYSDQTLIEMAQNFKEKLIVFESEFTQLLEKRLEQKTEVVYSNTAFVSEFDNEFCECVENLAYCVFDKGIIDILQNKVKFVLTANKTNASLTQEFYNHGVRQTIEIANICDACEITK